MKSVLILLSYLLPIVFVVVLVMLFLQKEKSGRKKLAYGLGIIFLLYIFMNVISFFLVRKKESPVAFDPSRWLSRPNERWLMKDDLIKSARLLDKDTAYIISILGDPESKSDTSDQWVYKMGEGGNALGFLFHNLIIEFENGHVIEVKETTWH